MEITSCDPCNVDGEKFSSAGLNGSVICRPSKNN